MAERGSTARLHPIHTLHSARDLESTVAHGFVKHGFMVMLHRVVDDPLQASRCLVSRTPCVYTRYTRVFWALGHQSHLSCFSAVLQQNDYASSSLRNRVTLSEHQDHSNWNLICRVL